MNFIEAVRTCFVRYFDFSGRSTRPEFWYYVLFLIIAGLIFDFIDASIAGEPFLDYEGLGFFGIIFFLLTMTTLKIKRFSSIKSINPLGNTIIFIIISRKFYPYMSFFSDLSNSTHYLLSDSLLDNNLLKFYTFNINQFMAIFCQRFYQH